MPFEVPATVTAVTMTVPVPGGKRALHEVVVEQETDVAGFEPK